MGIWKLSNLEPVLGKATSPLSSGIILAGANNE